jgi:hypothetical protein
MRQRKSVGTVRRAVGVRCLFDEGPLGLNEWLALAVEMAVGALANGSGVYFGTA